MGLWFFLLLNPGTHPWFIRWTRLNLSPLERGQANLNAVRRLRFDRGVFLPVTLDNRTTRIPVLQIEKITYPAGEYRCR